MNIEIFDFSVDILQVLLWQYDDAARLTSLITQKQDWYDRYQKDFWENWYTDVFNLNTANAFGLAVWAVILGVPLFINTQIPEVGAPLFGFNEKPPINDYENFGRSNFSNIGSNTVLTIEEQRLILKLRYFQLTTRADITDINAYLNFLFTNAPVGYGQVWALDDFDMTMTYVFNFYVPQIFRKVLRELDLLPRPAAVGIHYIILTDNIFGFNETPSINSYQNFFNSNFIPDF